MRYKIWAVGYLDVDAILNQDCGAAHALAPPLAGGAVVPGNTALGALGPAAVGLQPGTQLQPHGHAGHLGVARPFAIAACQTTWRCMIAVPTQASIAALAWGWG